MNRLFAISLCIFSFANSAAETVIEFPKVANDVDYANAANLSFTPAAQKITYGADPLQYALLWRATSLENTQRKPLVVLIHGGCWLSAYDIQHTFALSTGLAQAGFNVWSLEYRRSGDSGGGWPGSYKDIKAGILASAKYNNGEFDLSETVLVGHSAGGHLALLAGGAIKGLKSVIGLAAITDIEEYAIGSNSCQQATKDFMNGMPKEKIFDYEMANPSKQALHPNTLILQGGKDAIVPGFELDKLDSQVIMLDGVGHFDWIHPGSEAFDTLIKQLNGLLK
ncbi:alpha/beta fold hydrolase [Paraglaciecola arctica]|uniref:alpha/beta hydrolase family protein n=1 Tax=Paraglaciecola arctica TaxID=1128911 RepID=UPI001C06A6C1|nr:alpha/beta fold hydrolase [Paraglaciecola arctica]